MRTKPILNPDETTTPASVSVLKIKTDLLQRGFSVHRSKTENNREAFTRCAGIWNSSNIKMEIQLVFWMSHLSVIALE